MVLEGKTVDNPLRSFRFNASVVDRITGENSEYSKPAGYRTVRYPLSGLVGTCEAEEATKTHNAKYSRRGGRRSQPACIGTDATMRGTRLPRREPP